MASQIRAHQPIRKLAGHLFFNPGLLDRLAVGEPLVIFIHQFAILLRRRAFIRQPQIVFAELRLQAAAQFDFDFTQRINDFGPASVFAKEVRANSGRNFLTAPFALLNIMLMPLAIMQPYRFPLGQAVSRFRPDQPATA